MGQTGSPPVTSSPQQRAAAFQQYMGARSPLGVCSRAMLARLARSFILAGIWPVPATQADLSEHAFVWQAGRGKSTVKGLDEGS